ncbi:hypothetical protein B0W44_07550 [Novibacillus thermophilus]|uniref:SAF domain-containing protein n=1 Tax=Novibacillus thermophilus TaxID=1471761 RepID=A0A1U9K6L1_9BACL|nr:hypothetical protein B0W44_07550 [Novibacillus thermophilus]
MTNRITVAAILAIGISLLLYGATQWKVKAEMKPTPVIVAKEDIPPHTEITEDMLNTSVVVPREGVPPNAILNKEELIGKYTQVDYGVSKNSYFYRHKVVTAEELLDAERMKLKDGERLWTLQADIVASAAGNLVPGVLVDIWFTGTDENGKVVSGKLYEDVRVVGAKNKKAEDIVTMNTTDVDDDKQKSTDLYASVIQLALSDEQVQVMQKAVEVGKLRYIPKSGSLIDIDSEDSDETDDARQEELEESEEQAELLEWIKDQ